MHSVYGRGVAGRALESTCAACAARGGGSAARLLGRVSPFYRVTISAALGRLGALHVPIAESDGRVPALWIQRGKGLGGAYGAKVSRRCLNEEELASTLATEVPRVQLTRVELADLPFGEQLALFRRSAVLTGMHGAGYANLIFMPPGAAD